MQQCLSDPQRRPSARLLSMMKHSHHWGKATWKQLGTRDSPGAASAVPDKFVYERLACLLQATHMPSPPLNRSFCTYHSGFFVACHMASGPQGQKGTVVAMPAQCCHHNCPFTQLVFEGLSSAYALLWQVALKPL